MVRLPKSIGLAATIALLPFLQIEAATPSSAVQGITGRVVTNGKPVTGARVLAMPYRTAFDESRTMASKEPAPTPLARVVTGPDGRFSIAVEPDPGGKDRLFTLLVEGKGVSSVRGLLPFDATDVEEVGDVPVETASRVVVAVVSRAGTPIADAEVTVASLGSPRADGVWSPRPSVTRCREDGACELHLPRTPVELTVSAPGHATGFTTIAKLHGRPFVLEPAVEVTGVVEDGGRRVAGALVTVAGPWCRSRPVESDAEGRFRIPDAASATSTLLAETADGRYGRVPGLVVPRPPEAEPLRVALSAGSTLSGRAVDAATGKPVPRAKVLVISSRGRRIARSSADGRYRFVGLDRGPWTLTADHPRYVPFQRAEIQKSTVDLPLEPAGAIVGRVVDGQGKPVAGALVTAPIGELSLRYRSSLPRLAFLDRTSRSGADGGFRLDRVPPSREVLLLCRAGGSAPVLRRDIQVAAGGVTKGVTLTVTTGFALEGSVRDAAGSPVAGAEVRLSYRPPSESDLPGEILQPGASTTSDDEGRFSFTSLLAGRYSLFGKKSGLASGRLDSIPVGPEEAGASSATPPVLVLPVGARLQVVVRTREGGPAAARPLRVEAVESRRLMLGPQLETTNGDGVAVFEDLLAGQRYEIFSGYNGGARLAVVTPPTETVTVTLPPTGSLSGHVLDRETGRPLPEVSIAAFSSASRSNGSSGVGTTGADGSFLLEDLPSGAFEVSAFAQGYVRVRIAEVRVRDDERTEIPALELTKGLTLRGRVTDAGSGEPVRGASVWVSTDTGSSGDDETSDAEGRFVLTGLIEGRCRVRVTHASYMETTEPVSVGESDATIEVRLEAGGAIAGTVLDSARSPVADAKVTLAPSSRPCRSRPDGTFRIEHLPPGRYQLTVSTARLSAKSLDLALEKGESREGLVVTLDDGAVVRGRVVGVSNEQLPGIRVAARAPGLQRSTLTDAGGAFELSGIPSGTVTLYAQLGDPPTWRGIQRRVTVEEGQKELRVELSLDGTYRLSGRVLRANGEPVASRPAVQATPAKAPGERQFSTSADPEGVYALEGLAAGSYTVTTSANPGKTRTVEVAGDQSFDLVLPEATVAGTVVEAGSHRPLADVSVRSDTRAFTTTDGEGRFKLGTLDEGKVSLRFSRSGYRAEDVETKAVASGGDPLQVELTRSEGLGISVRDGQLPFALRSVRVSVSRGGTIVSFLQVPLDAEGRGEIPSLGPGHYAIRVSAPGYAPMVLPDVTVPAPTLAIAMTPGGNVEIRSGPKTQAADAYFFDLLLVDGASFFNVTGGPRVALIRPVHRLSNVPPGRVTLSLPDGSGKVLEVTEGATTLVELP